MCNYSYIMSIFDKDATLVNKITFNDIIKFSFLNFKIFLYKIIFEFGFVKMSSLAIFMYLKRVFYKYIMVFIYNT